MDWWVSFPFKNKKDVLIFMLFTKFWIWQATLVGWLPILSIADEWRRLKLWEAMYELQNFLVGKVVRSSLRLEPFSVTLNPDITKELMGDQEQRRWLYNSGPAPPQKILCVGQTWKVTGKKMKSLHLSSGRFFQAQHSPEIVKMTPSR